MPPRPQFTRDQRNWLVLEYYKRKGTMNFLPGLIADYSNKFPGARVPAFSTIRRLCKKQIDLGTVNNVNSKASPGDSHSGRIRTARTPPHTAEVKAVMDADSVKEIGDGLPINGLPISPVNSARKNKLPWCTKSSWSRIKSDIK